MLDTDENLVLDKTSPETEGKSIHQANATYVGLPQNFFW
jgi:hypothetical protein